MKGSEASLRYSEVFRDLMSWSVDGRGTLCSSLAIVGGIPCAKLDLEVHVNMISKAK